MTQPTHVSGTIKPLEWEGPDLESDFRAHHQFGWYVIYIIDRGHLLSRDGVVAGVFGTADAAKAAAQADYEARIAAQIQPDAGAQPVASSVTDLLVRVCIDVVTDANTDNRGFWRSCSGCHELNEGVPTGLYHPGLKCYIGLGCYECGGIGANWDTTDYAEMGEYLAHVPLETPVSDPQPALSDKGDAQASEAGDLLPCPFCAGKARVIRGVDGFYPPTAECDECGVRMKAPECLTGKLIAAWNRRALPAARAEVSVAEAARALLGDGDTMPSKAKLAAVSAYCRLEGLARPVAITDAWNAALRALTEAGE